MLRADLAALDRGTVHDGEVCDIAGFGPISLEALRDVLSDAVIALVLTNGVDVVNVTNLSRVHTAAQVSALQWILPGRCAVPGCQNRRRIELDHVHEFLTTGTTRVDDTQGLCPSHHRSKTPSHDYRA